MQDEGRQQHFAEKLAVAHQAWDEPGDVEFAQRPRDAGARGDQDQYAGPAVFEFRPCEHDGSASGRVMQQCLVTFDLGDDEPGTILGRRYGGQRDLAKPVPVRGDLPRLEARLLGRAQQADRVNLANIWRKAMREVRDIRGLTMIAQQQREAGKPRTGLTPGILHRGARGCLWRHATRSRSAP